MLLIWIIYEKKEKRKCLVKNFKEDKICGEYIRIIKCVIRIGGFVV